MIDGWNGERLIKLDTVQRILSKKMVDRGGRQALFMSTLEY